MTTGILGLSQHADGRNSPVAFPAWATIPSNYNLALSRREGLVDLEAVDVFAIPSSLLLQLAHGVDWRGREKPRLLRMGRVSTDYDIYLLR